MRNREKKVEQAIGINRRSREDQVRVMLLFKEADESNELEAFCRDTNYRLETARSYLRTYARYVAEGLAPEMVEDADNVFAVKAMVERWYEFHDTMSSWRMSHSVDRDGVEAAAKEMGLRGHTKAVDIAANPKSLQAAIKGDARAQGAAIEALFSAASEDTEVRQRLQEHILDLWHEEAASARKHGRPPADDAVMTTRMWDALDAAVRRVHDFENVPDSLLDMSLLRAYKARETLAETIIILEGRLALENH